MDWMSFDVCTASHRTFLSGTRNASRERCMGDFNDRLLGELIDAVK